MLVEPLASKQLGCKNIIEVWVSQTKKLQGDLDLISMPKLLEGDMGPRGMRYHCCPQGVSLKMLTPPLMVCQIKACK
jgi:hypothetical protein